MELPDVDDLDYEERVVFSQEFGGAQPYLRGPVTALRIVLAALLTGQSASAVYDDVVRHATRFAATPRPAFDAEDALAWLRRHPAVGDLHHQVPFLDADALRLQGVDVIITAAYARTGCLSVARTLTPALRRHRRSLARLYP